MIDFLFDNDLVIRGGDLATGESDNNHVKHILIANKGEFKASPELGVAIQEMLATESPNQFLIDAKRNLQYDGMQVTNISLTENGTINVDAKYTT
ncbi:MAG: oxidase [Chryseobacterium gambrini]|nr:oxidase [Chryseobacterium gambrini]